MFCNDHKIRQIPPPVGWLNQEIFLNWSDFVLKSYSKPIALRSRIQESDIPQSGFKPNLTNYVMRIKQKQKQEAIRAILKEIRIKKGLSKNRVLELSDVDVSKYESGYCYPKLDALENLCEAYEIHPVLFLIVIQAYLNSDVSCESAIKILLNRQELTNTVEMVYEIVVKASKEVG